MLSESFGNLKKAWFPVIRFCGYKSLSKNLLGSINYHAANINEQSKEFLMNSIDQTNWISRALRVLFKNSLWHNNQEQVSLNALECFCASLWYSSRTSHWEYLYYFKMGHKCCQTWPPEAVGMKRCTAKLHHAVPSHWVSYLKITAAAVIWTWLKNSKLKVLRHTLGKDSIVCTI